MSTIASPAELELPLLALPDAVLFPGTIARIELSNPGPTDSPEHQTSTPGAFVAVFAQRNAHPGPQSTDDFHPIGALARVVTAGEQDGKHVVILQGVERAELIQVTAPSPPLMARVRRLEQIEAADEELDALFQNLRAASRRVVELLRLPREVAAQLGSIDRAAVLADVIASRMDATREEKLALLGTLDVKARVRAVLERVLRRTQVLETRASIDATVSEAMDKKQREHILREQKRAIERELAGAADDDGEDDLDALEKRIAAAGLSQEARAVATRQLHRLQSMQPGSPEFSMVRTYVEWLVDLPWTEASEDNPDIAAVRAVLDADHYGLEKVKKRILEYLAVRKLKSDKKGPILCLIGPPGVGKTSLGKSIARALGRKFHRISLGGVHDEAAIRGHRRTYVGALPGNVIQGLKKVGVTNPVFMLDEVDKLGHSGMHGDPSSALLEVLDPEQNDSFTDHYVEIPYDLSNVMFVATANVGDTIPAPLRDRMEIIEIPSYTRQEKLAIARRHLVPKQLAEHGVGADKLDVTDEALKVIVERYTREAGVRSLEKKIAAVVRGVAVQFAEGREEPAVVRTEEDVRAFLGAAPHEDQRVERASEPGVAVGLAWTPVGGQVLFVEATKMPGSGKLTLTGQLGDVMKESAHAALSYVRANTDRWGIPSDFLDKSDIHVHVPAGGMPKDGPSAGVTMLTALVSVLSGVRARHDVAMTGEITLRGRVLPIGGLKEKLLAAHRAGIKRVIVPERNRADLEEVPEDVRRELEIVLVSHMSEVIDAALEQRPPSRRASVVGGGTVRAALAG